MRTTLNLPDDLMTAVSTISKSRGTTMGEVVADLVRRGLAPVEGTGTATEKNGFTVFAGVGVPEQFGPEDVMKALDGEDAVLRKNF